MSNDSKGWTLITRFSNNDGKTWMRDDGNWWYDQQVAMGTTTDPSINADMISPAFWLVSGRELKITRSDDSSHTPLLQTTGNCLAGQTFRSKITSYGDFRNGKVWSSNRCLGSCTVQYGGQYKSTDGFQQAECSGGIQSNNKIGFWCDWDSGDGSVMMIGGGGKECDRADHGIGITEANEASFDHDGVEYDFGYDYLASQSYSLNLWIRWLTSILSYFFAKVTLSIFQALHLKNSYIQKRLSKNMTENSVKLVFQGNLKIALLFKFTTQLNVILPYSLHVTNA